MRSPTPNCLQITTFIHRIAPVFGVIFLAACGPVGPGESGDLGDDTGSETGSDETDTGDILDMTIEPDAPKDICESHPGSLGCPCTGGDCVTNLVCNGVGCTPCPMGSPGCPCGDGRYCETDVCLSSSTWSVCVPEEGPILCIAGVCPGDMICGEPALQYCAWPSV